MSHHCTTLIYKVLNIDPISSQFGPFPNIYIIVRWITLLGEYIFCLLNFVKDFELASIENRCQESLK